ncbi:MAG: hypothetical protein ABL886_10950, partial [Rhodoglobus sp.]
MIAPAAVRSSSSAARAGAAVAGSYKLGGAASGSNVFKQYGAAHGLTEEQVMQRFIHVPSFRSALLKDTVRMEGNFGQLGSQLALGRQTAHTAEARAAATTALDSESIVLVDHLGRPLVRSIPGDADIVLAERAFRAPRRPEQIRDQRKVGALDVAEDERRPAGSDHAAMNLGRFEVR